MPYMSNFECEWMTTCVKCGKGGNVLHCNGCPIVVHKSCMACPARFDSAGNFSCPHCLYKKSVEELNTARNNLLTAKTALSMFPNGTAVENKGDHEAIVKGIIQFQEENKKKKHKVGEGPVRATGNDDDVSRKTLDEVDKPIFALTGRIVEENENMAQCDNEKPSDHGMSKCSEVGDKPHTAIEVVGTSRTCTSSGVVAGEKIVSDNCLQEDGPTPRNMGAADEVQQLDTTSDAEIEEEAEAEEAAVAFDSLQDDQEVEQVTEVSEEAVSTRQGDGDGEQQAEMASKGAGGDKINTKTRRGGGVGRSPHNERREILHEHARSHFQRKRKSKDNGQSVENSREKPNGTAQFECEEDSLMASDSDVEVIKVPPKRGNFAVLSYGKRQKLRWTDEEVEMLKQAVVMFSSHPKKNLPWRKMLEYGSDVFDRARTPSDLKDKWKLELKRAGTKAYPSKKKDGMEEEEESW